MNRNTEIMYWHSNPDWYKRDYERDEFVLLDSAPERAKKSFELWKKYQEPRYTEADLTET